MQEFLIGYKPYVDYSRLPSAILSIMHTHFYPLILPCMYIMPEIL